MKDFFVAILNNILLLALIVMVFYFISGTILTDILITISIVGGMIVLFYTKNFNYLITFLLIIALFGLGYRIFDIVF